MHEFKNGFKFVEHFFKSKLYLGLRLTGKYKKCVQYDFDCTSEYSVLSIH